MPTRTLAELSRRWLALAATVGLLAAILSLAASAPASARPIAGTAAAGPTASVEGYANDVSPLPLTWAGG